MTKLVISAKRRKKLSEFEVRIKKHGDSGAGTAVSVHEGECVEDALEKAGVEYGSSDGFYVANSSASLGTVLRQGDTILIVRKYAGGEVK
tara:strand:+ start:67 stop:336 length:270 start_codon:yes stop_codon:yes gene_type:complete